ncbi:hypothetical protein WCT94_09250 [Pectobacterium sp. 1950-15]|uniref:hypothetical protein n=1 Tax=Pectobacterium sp. 1950-15 TaxID=3128982 RepID=UPI0030169C2B
MQNIILIIAVSAFSALYVLLFSSIIYFCIVHIKGTLSYFLKTAIIGLMTTPVAILLLCLMVLYLLKRLWSRIIIPGWHFVLPPASNANTPDRMTSESPPDTMIHLIHGTFEKNAPWTQEGSAMREKLRTLGPDIGVTNFTWSSDNSASTRTQAAIDLARKLADSPAKHNYIIAHSHGGAIVREMSYMHKDIAHKISGACLLSPPFIYRAHIERTSGKLIKLFNISGTISAQLLLALILVPLGIYDVTYAIALAASSFFLELVIAPKWQRAVTREIENEKKDDNINLSNVKIYQAIGDEADSGLRFISSFHEGCFGLISQLKMASSSAEKLLLWSTTLSYLFYTLAALIIYFFFPDDNDWLWVCLGGLITVVIVHICQHFWPSKDIPHVLIIAALPVAVFSFWLSVAKALAYGDLRLIFCPEVFVSSSETPSGKHTVEKFTPQRDGMLIHSTHSNEKAIDNVVKWLRESEENRKELS